MFLGVDSPVIRFSCTKCGREYLLSNALSHLPLLCKGCGDRIVVPDPSESLPEPPPAPPPPKPAFERSLPAAPPTIADQPDILITPTVEDSEVNLFLSPEVRQKLFLPMEGSGATVPPALMPPSPAVEPAPSSVEADDDTPPRKWKLIDGVGLLIMLLIGAFVGEFVARKSTLQILGDAPASPKFPPTDLVLWVGSVAVFGLLYVWLVARGWGLGVRFKRR